MTRRTARQVHIEGLVQGVWYRGWTVDQAAQRGLSGWVRNRRDGSVAALFAGPQAEVEAMVALCRQGPPAAQVTAVTAEAADPPDGDGFFQLPTE